MMASLMFVLYGAAAAVFLFLAGLVLRRIIDTFARCGSAASKRHIAVLVLGDVGRSPRMQYHCLSLAGLPAQVSLVGYRGEKCVPALVEHPRITQYLISPPGLTQALPRLVGMPIKVLWQMGQLMCILLVQLPTLDVLLLQNPPSIPTLFVALLAGAVRGFSVVVDWHNFGYTLLAMRFASGEKHPVVRFARLYERVLGRLCHGGLCVTKAMQTWLWKNWRVKAEVLHDRAPAFFRRQTSEESEELFKRLAVEYPMFRKLLGGGSKPALVVSATSWTADEDFGMLLTAVEALDQLPGPPLLFVVTGKGPLKAYYESRIAAMHLRRCEVTTAWLEAADYPKLLGSATLGVSLHTSSSGLDLPMKVVDMFGAGLPVCALGFSCLDELVTHGSNGMVFTSANELTEQLQNLLSGTAEGSRKLEALQEGVKSFQSVRWQDNWDANAAPLFRGS